MPNYPVFAETALKFIGVPSLFAGLGLYTTWISLKPELVVETVIDKSKSLCAESRIRIKNIGKLPALAIQPKVVHLNARIGSNLLTDCGAICGSTGVSRLSGGESVEISVSPGIVVEGMTISELSYVLVINHEVVLFLFRKNFEKRWRVELRNFEDGFAWQVSQA